MTLPAGREAGSDAGGEGVWVLGLIRGSAADEAGLEQGDQLLTLDGSALAGRSPFEVASLLQGQEGEAEAGTALGLGLEHPSVQLMASLMRAAGGGCCCCLCCS